MTRRVFYKKDSERYDAYLGVKVTAEMDAAIEREAVRQGRLKTEFIRHLIIEGLRLHQRDHPASELDGPP